MAQRRRLVKIGPVTVTGRPRYALVEKAKYRQGEEERRHDYSNTNRSQQRDPFRCIHRSPLGSVLNKDSNAD
jgi:hypothetical protein